MHLASRKKAEKKVKIAKTRNGRLITANDWP